MRRSLLAIACSWLALAVPARADVSPYAVWSIATNGVIEGATQSGSAIYFGGTFTKVGRAVAPFEGFLDRSTLNLTVDPGCARQGTSLLAPWEDGTPRLFVVGRPPFGSLRDGAGPFVVAADVTHVRVGSDCRFDRHFALRLPVGAGLTGEAVPLGDRLYSGVSRGFFSPTQEYYVVAFDGRTGDLVHAWPVSGYVDIVGAAHDGRLAVVTYSTFAGDRALGFFDPADGSLSAVRTLAGRSGITMIPVGTRALIRWASLEGGQHVTHIEACDIGTWHVLPQWPQVRMTGEPVALAATSVGRLLIAGNGLQIDTEASRSIAAFDLATGAHDPSWNAPAWMSDVTSTDMLRMTLAGSRLLVYRDFVPGAPRDAIVALDLATGALDPWEFAFHANTATAAGGVVYVGSIGSTRQVGRPYLAAVDASTGDLLPWEPAALLPTSDISAAAAVVHDGAFVYAAHRGGVRRYDAGSGVRDETWRLDAMTAIDTPATVNRLALGPDVLYATGDFDVASDQSGSAQVRNGGVAIRLSGALIAWNPRVASTCSRGRVVPVNFPCIGDISVTPDRVFLRGTLIFGDTPSLRRAFAAVSTDTGVLDTSIPSPTVSGITSGMSVLYVSAVLDGQPKVVRVDPGLRISLLPQSTGHGATWLAARRGRVYAGVELDDTTGAPTGNSNYWVRPVSADGGVLDIRGDLGFHPDITEVPPGAPTDLVSSVDAAAVTLRWARAVTDLQPRVLPPPSGGTAATSHVVTVSATAGGPPIAQLDTASAETAYTVTTPPGVYFARVQARNAFGASAPSNEVRVEVRPSAPDPPVAIVATVSGRTVRVQWQAAPSGWPVVSYVLEAGSRPGATDVAVVSVSGIEFRASEVPTGRYFVRVRAVNVHGTSAAGQEVVVDVS